MFKWVLKGLFFLLFNIWIIRKLIDIFFIKCVKDNLLIKLYIFLGIKFDLVIYDILVYVMNMCMINL